MRINKTLAIFIASGLLASCGPKTMLAPQLSQKNSGQIAVLPLDAPADITREKAAYIRKAIVSELKSNRFLVLDDNLVSKVCTTPHCPERAALVKNFLAENFVEIKLNSITRNNFVAGYYNAIGGELTLSDSSGAELATVKHTESERGGLLFNSGQILQGLKSQVENSKTDSFNRLAEKFAHTLVAQLPAPPSGSAAASEATALDISSVEITPLKPPLYRVCSHATPKSMAFFVLNNQKTNLRETEPGHYCGDYSIPVANKSGAMLGVELRSPFGNTLRKDIEPPAVATTCALDGLIKLRTSGSAAELALDCSPTAERGKCESLPTGCQDNKFVVYRSDKPSGPFRRVAEFSGGRWKDLISGHAPFYQVVAVNRLGIRSQPAAPVVD